MKKLEELGISPAPWKPVDDGMGYNDIRCNTPITEDSEGEDIIAELIDIKDARLMAAAPKLYNELWKQCFGEIGTVNCRNCKGAKWGVCHKCKLGSARAALTEAAGEMEIK